MVVHVDAAALQDKGGKSDLPVESVRRIACDADLVAVTRDAKGNLAESGQKASCGIAPTETGVAGAGQVLYLPVL